MANHLANKLIVAISSRALFNLDESNLIYEQHGIEAYLKYQIANEDNILEPGVAFHLVKKITRVKRSAKKSTIRGSNFIITQ